MDNAFWLERWQQGQIGWHQDEVTLQLNRFWGELPLSADTRVFVPLCGKSLDLAWLAGRGHSVIGVEISPLAVKTFFREHQAIPGQRDQAPFQVWSAGSIDILCGDYFKLDRESLGPVGAFFDRASLVALPPEMRRRYAAHLAKLLPSGTQGLLICLEYDQQEMQGPPFSVAEDEVTTLFDPQFKVHLIHTLDALTANPKLRERGLNRLQEKVYQLYRR